jgi:ribosome maturation factor RimP
VPDNVDIDVVVRDLIGAARPDVMVWDVAADPRRGQLRVMIDTDEGVSLDLCEEISRHLAPLREEWGLEVSSPGLDRALVRPEHYRRMVGREAAFVLREPVDGRSTFDGALVDADEDAVTVRIDDEEIVVPYRSIKKATCLWKLVKPK